MSTPSHLQAAPHSTRGERERGHGPLRRNSSFGAPTDTSTQAHSSPAGTLPDSCFPSPYSPPARADLPVIDGDVKAPLSMYPSYDYPYFESPQGGDDAAAESAVRRFAMSRPLGTVDAVTPPRPPANAAPFTRQHHSASPSREAADIDESMRVRASRRGKSEARSDSPRTASDDDDDDAAHRAKIAFAALPPRPPPGDPMNQSRPMSSLFHRSGEGFVDRRRSMMMDHLVNADGMDLDDDDDEPDAERRLSLEHQRQRAMLLEDHHEDDVADVSTHLDDEDATKVRRDSAVVVFDREGNPDMLDGLTFFRQLGSGASGVVWHCLDNNVDEERAVKAIPRRNCGRSNIATLPEVEVMKNLRHRNIVRLYECIDDPSQPVVYLVMQFVQGGAIATMAPDGTCTPIPLRELGPVLQGITSALVHCHRLCVVHGDVKPDNILVDRSHAGKVHAYLADFGVALACYRKPIDACDSVCHGTVEDFLRAVGEGDTEVDTDTLSNNSSSRAAQFALRGPGALGGTPAFLAPEVLSGQERTPASDMWALGVTIFCLLFGHLPFAFAPDGGLAALKKVVCEGEPTFPPEATTSPSLRRWKVVIKQLLQKDPALRLTAVQLSRCKLLYHCSTHTSLHSSTDFEDKEHSVVAGSIMSELSISSMLDMNAISQLSSYVSGVDGASSVGSRQQLSLRTQSSRNPLADAE